MMLTWKKLSERNFSVCLLQVIKLCSRVHVDFDLAMVEMKEAGDEGGPLQDEGGQKHVFANAAQAITLHESHQEAKPNEHHHVHILEH
jgi:hypothetical protein